MISALTIAGSDSGGGAGIQADIKTFAAFKVHGTSVITSVTAQNTRGVQGCCDLPPAHIALQIDSVFQDIGAHAVKTGMLGNESIVDIVSKKIRKHKVSRLVVDPVLSAGSGMSLLSDRGEKELTKKLLPLAYLITPNIPEAESLSGIKISNHKDMEKAAEYIGGRNKNVLIKGGHLRADRKKSVDLLFHRGKHYFYESERVTTRHTHGTGCVLSAAITAGLASGKKLRDAIEDGKQFITDAIKNFLDIGNGIGTVNPVGELWKDVERYKLIVETGEAVERLKKADIGPLIPEIQSNFAVALEGACEIRDVIGFPGRIIRLGHGVAVVSGPAFGGSAHMAKVVLTAMRCDPSKRSAMNLRYSRDIVKLCKSLKFSIRSFSREKEPKHVKIREGSTLEWGVSEVIKKSGFVPDIIYDTGGMGKEPVIRVIADSPHELADKVLMIDKVMK